MSGPGKVGGSAQWVGRPTVFLLFLSATLAVCGYGCFLDAFSTTKQPRSFGL